jgi:signal transduction histidine kinase
LGRFRDELEIAVYRIVQEGLANVLRHSGSTEATISLHRKAPYLELAVSDRGKSPARGPMMKAYNSRSGVGIGGMRERVEQLGGRLSIHCNAAGTTLKAAFPLEMGFHG